MSADSRYPPRMTRSELWRAAPWWERTLYVLAFLLPAVFVLLTELVAYAPVAWYGQTTLRLTDIAILVAVVAFPLDVAAFAIARRLWSTRLFLRVAAMRSAAERLSAVPLP